MKLTELAERLLRGTYAENAEGTPISDLVHMAEQFGVQDKMLVCRAGQLLKDRGFLEELILVSGFGCAARINAGAMALIEEVGEDRSVVEHVKQSKRPGDSYTVHGPVYAASFGG